MADKMPLDVLRQRLVLLAQFLLVALAEDALTLGVGGLDILVRVILGNCHKANTLWQRIEHLVQVTFNVVVHQSSYSGLSSFFCTF